MNKSDQAVFTKLHISKKKITDARLPDFFIIILENAKNNTSQIYERKKIVCERDSIDKHI